METIMELIEALGYQQTSSNCKYDQVELVIVGTSPNISDEEVEKVKQYQPKEDELIFLTKMETLLSNQETELMGLARHLNIEKIFSEYSVLERKECEESQQYTIIGVNHLDLTKKFLETIEINDNLVKQIQNNKLPGIEKYVSQTSSQNESESNKVKEKMFDNYINKIKDSVNKDNKIMLNIYYGHLNSMNNGKTLFNKLNDAGVKYIALRPKNINRLESKDNFVKYFKSLSRYHI